MIIKILFDVFYHDGYWVRNNELAKIGFCWIHEILSKILLKFQNRNQTIQIDFLQFFLKALLNHSYDIQSTKQSYISQQKSINQNTINKQKL